MADACGRGREGAVCRAQDEACARQGKHLHGCIFHALQRPPVGGAWRCDDPMWESGGYALFLFFVVGSEKEAGAPGLLPHAGDEGLGGTLGDAPLVVCAADVYAYHVVAGLCHRAVYPLLELWNALLCFSDYAGIGIKTGIGMGGVQAIFHTDA